KVKPTVRVGVSYSAGRHKKRRMGRRCPTPNGKRAHPTWARGSRRSRPPTWWSLARLSRIVAQALFGPRHAIGPPARQAVGHAYSSAGSRWQTKGLKAANVLSRLAVLLRSRVPGQ